MCSTGGWRTAFFLDKQAFGRIIKMRLIDAESPQNGIYVSDLVIEEMKKIPTVEIDRPTRS